jgi:hypothetical protein
MGRKGYEKVMAEDSRVAEYSAGVVGGWVVSKDLRFEIADLRMGRKGYEKKMADAARYRWLIENLPSHVLIQAIWTNEAGRNAYVDLPRKSGAIISVDEVLDAVLAKKADAE